MEICVFLLASTTSYYLTESAAPGEGRGGGIGGGGEPLRYGFTGRGRNTISPWNDATYTYSILQIGLGSNPISKLEVASALNTVNIGTYTYHYNSNNCTTKYNPKIYLGTSQTIALGWIYDLQNIEKYPETWPEVKPQKGEVNISNQLNHQP